MRFLFLQKAYTAAIFKPVSIVCADCFEANFDHKV